MLLRFKKLQEPLIIAAAAVAGLVLHPRLHTCEEAIMKWIIR